MAFWTKEKIDQLVKKLKEVFEHAELGMFHDIDASKIVFSHDDMILGFPDLRLRTGHVEGLILPFQLREVIYDTFKEWCEKNNFLIMEVYVYYKPGPNLHMKFDVHLSEPFNTNLLTILPKGCAFVKE